MNRLIASLAILARWYATPTGVLYALAVAAAGVATVLSPRWGLLVVLLLVAVGLPYKVARLDRQRRAGLREFYALRGQHRGLHARHGEATAEFRSEIGRSSAELAEMRTGVKRAESRAHLVRRDALAGVDTARHEWAEIVRAERRTTEANIRSQVRREVSSLLAARRDDDAPATSSGSDATSSES